MEEKDGHIYFYTALGKYRPQLWNQRSSYGGYPATQIRRSPELGRLETREWPKQLDLFKTLDYDSAMEPTRRRHQTNGKRNSWILILIM